MTLVLAPLRSLLPSALFALAASLAFVVTPSQAQYKVIGGDGKVTYTDRAPNVSEGRVSALGARGPAQPAEPELPFELRQIASRYPVTLYTASGACEPCVLARQLLKQRGIPFSERQVVTSDDSDALERVAGARDVPTLMIGSHVMRGLSNDAWISYLDAAGYPRESRLPASYQYRPATPIIDRREPAVARGGDVVAPAAVSPPATAAPAGPGGIRF
jgi:glutaredoxin